MSGPESVRTRVQRVRAHGGEAEILWDRLAPEEPMEIRLGFGPINRRAVRTIGITMRTPGHDAELAVGFLLNERVIPSAEAIDEVAREEPEDAGRSLDRIIRVDLKPRIEVDLERFARNVLTNSSCGVCGTATLRALNLDGCRPNPAHGPVVEAETIHRLPDLLRYHQRVFVETGGLHAAALLDAQGSLIAAREDIGRHNTVDKLIGARALGTLDGPHPDADPAILLVSGRAGFEIVQKAVTARLPIVAAVGAPSSLAVEVAETFGLTLCGFVGPDRFNVYSAPWRVRVRVEAASISAADPAR